MELHGDGSSPAVGRVQQQRRSIWGSSILGGGAGGTWARYLPTRPDRFIVPSRGASSIKIGTTRYSFKSGGVYAHATQARLGLIR